MLLLFTGILISCRKSDDHKTNDLIGTWKLIEVFSSPGDGSGIFQSVSSDKTIEFKPDGTVTSNGSLCIMSIESGSPSSGTYSLSDSTIHSPDCQNGPLRFHKKGTTLTISYPCFEPCMAKYIKKD